MQNQIDHIVYLTRVVFVLKYSKVWFNINGSRIFHIERIGRIAKATIDRNNFLNAHHIWELLHLAFTEIDQFRNSKLRF